MSEKLITGKIIIYGKASLSEDANYFIIYLLINNYLFL